MPTRTREEYKAPKHLRAPTRRWVQGIAEDYLLESHHLKLLQAAAESWDRAQQARAALAVYGLTYLDRFGAPHGRPEVAIERDARVAFARLIRELGLDVSEPEPERPPVVRGQRRR